MPEEIEDELMKLRAQNEELRGQIAARLVQTEPAEGRIISAALHLHDGLKHEKDLATIKAHYDSLKILYSNLQATSAETESKLRQIIHSNQEIVQKWSNRQLTTEDDVVAVKLVVP